LIEEVKKSKFKIILSDEDKAWLSSEYPSLNIQNKKLSGEICFQRTSDNISILECFNIQVILKYNEKSILPKIICTDEKIENIANELNKKLDDLHINHDNSFCLTVPQKERDFFEDGIFNIRDFFKNLVEPFLYWISYYQRYGKAPWSEYSHGILGIYEYIGEDDSLKFKMMYKILKDEKQSLRKILKLYRQSQCLCGSNIKMRKCHNGIWQGIKKIKFLTCLRIIKFHPTLAKLT